MSDQRLAWKAKFGDQEALETLIRKHYQSVYRYFVRKLSDEQLALDMTQETFYRLTKRIYTYKPLASFTTYLYTIANHLAIDCYRKKTIDELDEQHIPFTTQNCAEQLHDGLMVAHLLQQLSEKQRECIILYYYQHLKYRQIAHILNIPESTVKTRVRTGIAKCHELWKEEEQ